MMEYRQGQKVVAQAKDWHRHGMPIRFTVTIRRVGYTHHDCLICKGLLSPGILHAVWGAWHFCLKCINPA